LLDAAFKDSECYCLWKFVYVPYRWAGGATVPGTAGAPPPGQPGPGAQLPGGPTTAPGVPLPGNPTPN
jgi:hypothetical protein